MQQVTKSTVQHIKNVRNYYRNFSILDLSHYHQLEKDNRQSNYNIDAYSDKLPASHFDSASF